MKKGHEQIGKKKTGIEFCGYVHQRPETVWFCELNNYQFNAESLKVWFRVGPSGKVGHKRLSLKLITQGYNDGEVDDLLMGKQLV